MPDPSEREYLKQYCKMILTGQIISCQKIQMLCAMLLDKLLHPEKYAPYVFGWILPIIWWILWSIFVSNPLENWALRCAWSFSSLQGGRQFLALSIRAPAYGSTWNV